MSTDCMIEISARHACRRFTPHEVQYESLRAVLEAGRLAPSGFGLEPWRFLVVQETILREQVAEACFSQPPAATAPALIILVALLEALRPGSSFVKRQLEAEAGDSDPAPVMETYREFHDSVDIAQWAMGQCQIAAAFMMLEAVHQQLATCPIGGFDEQILAAVLNLPAGEKPALVLALGHCADAQRARRRRARAEVITYLGE
ncbi:MAG TPA: nitroreductase family protein [Thiobacillaceae bacterium]|nr:nitroreductase family protein [Thiobacillaceae bacterium]